MQTTCSGHTFIADNNATKALIILKWLLQDYHPRNFSVRLWDGSQWLAETDPPRFELIFKNPAALWFMLRNATTDLSISEAYVHKDLDVEGDFDQAILLGFYLLARNYPASTLMRLSWRTPLLDTLLRIRRQPVHLHGKLHSIERDRQAVRYHYDVSNAFYSLWLDQRMVYSCAYFERADEDLDTAQLRKLDYICRKLRLRPHERLLDIGCGWGGLAIHAAQRYGVEALGITLSRNQAEVANARIARAGVQKRCRVEVRDYRDLDDVGEFEKMVSVGMFEHVGESRLPLYFEHAWRLLRPGGVFLNHGIARRATDTQSKGSTFVGRYVFPDGELLPIHAALRYAEEAGFEVRDLESLREHYTLTLRHWARGLDVHRDEALRVVSEPTYRVWRLFLHGSAYAFAVGSLNLYQAVLLKPDQGQSKLPLTRDDWYSRPLAPAVNPVT